MTSTRAALATCQGLMGYFITDGEEYLIEPVKGHTGSLDQGHPHVVYKRSAIPAHLGGTSKYGKPYEGTCGVNGDFASEIKRREKWERRRRNAERKDPAKKSRRKRSISIEKHVEMLVVIDPIMVQYYANSDLETYVLTIINMVSSVFHDASIGNALNIVLVKIILLEEDQDDLKITHHADNTLSHFCKWQKKLNPKGEEHANHHDIAVLMTRKNICSRMNQPCGTLGLAQVAGLCQPHRSCNINQDTGLALAYTLSHELGHNFGMRHDGVHNNCESPNTGRQHVMAPHIMSDSVPLVWSNCSRQAITRFLDRNWGYCLDDEPSSHDFDFPLLPPGTMYDADHQCSLQYGPQATICDGIENVCDTLWCRVNNGCATKLEAAVEGTLCGENRWCMDGKCQLIGERPESINGEWGVWGGWSECTRTCGAGVAYSQRHCENPPPSNGGKYCIGERKRYRICNIEPCSEDEQNFRQYQCSEFNKKPYKKKYYEWEPVSSPNTPCQLHCKPKDNYFSVLLRDIVTDGTSCSVNGRHMCIGGRCRHVGCDWVLDSKAADDRCGVCHGDGSSCLTVKQQFKDKQGNGYVEATIIPKGARNIHVEEVAEAINYLALRSDKGDYFLNGNWFIQWSGEYEVAGTVGRYQRIGNKESFEAPGPIKEPLHIMLLFQSDNPGLVFEYTVPNENATDDRIPEFHWEYSDWSHCTVSCGGGSQRSQVICMEREAGHVDDRYCNATTKPDDQSRACNNHQCPARWWLGPWQHCSVTCGQNGIHRRTVICVRSLGPDEQIALEDSACEGQEKPARVEKCRKKPACPELGNWVVGEWEMTCNGNPCAYHSRPVTCDRPQAGCDPQTKPPGRQQCGNITCGTWEAGLWSQCTRSCGGGMQYRNVYCDGGQSCDLEIEPPAERRCKMVTCPITTTATTLSSSTTTTTAPSTVPTSSSTRLASRTTSPRAAKTTSEFPVNTPKPKKLAKFNTKGSDIKYPTTEKYVFPTVPDELVPKSNKITSNNSNNTLPHSPNVEKQQQKLDINQPVNLKMPEHNQPKNVPLLGEKTPDSKPLNLNSGPVINLNGGNGDLMTEEDFEKNFPPILEEGGYESVPLVPEEKAEDTVLQKVHNLDLGSANPGIISSVKSEMKLSEVVNADPKDTYNIAGKPGNSKHGPGISRQNIRDNRHGLDFEESSLMETRKTTTTSTTTTPTPVTYKWILGEWSKCSRHCGGGVRTRSVTCVESDNDRRVNKAYCDETEEPALRESCHTMACLEWTASEWQPCSAACGEGVQRRHVHCPAHHRCDPHQRPPHLQPCQLKTCLNWEPGQWSLCTRTCGKGEQVRLVSCMNVTSRGIATGCDEMEKPSTRQSCQLADCPERKTAITTPCVSNQMGHKLCHALKQRGQCNRQFIQRKCCKSCGLKFYEVYKQPPRKPDRRHSSVKH